MHAASLYRAVCIVCCLLALPSPTPVAAQQDCSLTDARAVDGPLGYKPRAKGRYCEGIVEGTNSAGIELEIVSFSKGSIQFYPADAEVITIRPLAPAGLPVQLHGRSFDIAARYRFDCATLTGASHALNAATVIAQIPVPKENLGLYAARLDNGEVYLPVHVSSKLWPTPAARGYVLQLVKNVGFATADYRYARIAADGTPGPMSEPVPVAVPDNRSSGLSVALPPAMTGGRYRLRVSYKLDNGHPGSRDFILQVP